MSSKKLKKYVFDAGNSDTGVAGLIVAVRAHNGDDAVRLANDFLRRYQYEPLKIEGAKFGAASEEAGVEWALFCVGPNLTKRDIER